MYANTTGNNNVALGYNALTSNTTSSDSTAVGTSALAANTAAQNTAVGSQALAANTSGTPNTAIGYNAMAATTTGGSNVALGDYALAALTSNGGNTAVGSNVLTANTANYNTALGFQALKTNTTGTHNIGIGISALYSATSSNYNTVVGDYAASTITSGASGNVALGYAALNVASGGGHTAVGYQALNGDTTGISNIAIGYNAGSNITTGSSNIIIGNMNAPSATASNQLYIGGILYGDLSTGRVGLGLANTSPSYDLSLLGTTARTIGLERNTTASTAGQNLTLQAGAATAAGTNLAGGNLLLASGIATGTGTSAIYFYTGTAGATGTADNTTSLKMTITGSGNVGIGAAGPTTTLDVAGPIRTESDSTSICATVGAGTIRWNGTQFQGCDGTAWAGLTALGGSGSGASNPFYLTPDGSNLIYLGANGSDATAANRQYLQATANATTGDVTGLSLLVSGAAKLTLNSTGDVALASTTASTSSTTGSLRVGGGLGIAGDVYMGGTAARTIAMDRNAAAAAGNNLTISASGAASGTTNLAGGSLYLKGGTATGSGISTIYFQNASYATSGTSDNAPTAGMIVQGSTSQGGGGNVAIGFAPSISAGTRLSVSSSIYDGQTAAFNQINGDANNTIRFKSIATTATNTNVLSMLRSNGSSSAYPNSSDRLGKIDFVAANNATTVIAASIYGEMDGASGGSTDVPGRLVFATTTDGTATLSERMRIQNDGKVGIGVTAPAEMLDVGTGNVRAAAFINSSDARLKDNIEVFRDGLATVRKLRGVTFTWKKDGTPAVGLIAQEVEPVLPQLVRTEGDGMKAVMYANIVAPLIEAVKELADKFDALEAKVAALFDRADKTDARLDALEQKLQSAADENVRLKAENKQLQKALGTIDALSARVGKIEARHRHPAAPAH